MFLTFYDVLVKPILWLEEEGEAEQKKHMSKEDTFKIGDFHSVL